MKEALICAMDIGEQMLVCGAEIHRVENSMERMCYALGVIIAAAATKTLFRLLPQKKMIQVHN